MNIYILLEDVKLRKEMYLGNGCNLKSLDTFISGFLMASTKEQLKFKSYPDFMYFFEWQSGYLNTTSDLSKSW